MECTRTYIQKSHKNPSWDFIMFVRRKKVVTYKSDSFTYIHPIYTPTFLITNIACHNSKVTFMPTQCQPTRKIQTIGFCKCYKY